MSPRRLKAAFARRNGAQPFNHFAKIYLDSFAAFVAVSSPLLGIA
jgi:hypothetical protein